LKYAFIHRHRRVWPISVQCRVLQASVALPRAHFCTGGQQPQRRHRRDDALLVHIKAIHTDEGWLFLAVVIDLFSRKVMGWSLRAGMMRKIAIDRHLIGYRQPAPPILGFERTTDCRGGSHVLRCSLARDVSELPVVLEGKQNDFSV
jgi:transposase InsO family protein